MSTSGQRTKWGRKIAENFNRLSMAHERYRQTDRLQTDDKRQTDGRRHNFIAIVRFAKTAKVTTAQSS